MTMKHRLCFMSGLLLSILVDGAVSWSNCKTCSGEYKYCEYGCCDYNCCPNVVGIILGTVGAAVILSVLLGGVVIYIVQNRYNREPQKNLNTTTPESKTIDTINLPPESRERRLSEMSTQNNVAQEPPADIFR